MKVGKNIQKGISDSDTKINISVLKCWLCKYEVASLVTTGTFISFSFSVLLLYQQR